MHGLRKLFKLVEGIIKVKTLSCIFLSPKFVICNVRVTEEIQELPRSGEQNMSLLSSFLPHFKLLSKFVLLITLPNFYLSLNNLVKYVVYQIFMLKTEIVRLFETEIFHVIKCLFLKIIHQEECSRRRRFKNISFIVKITFIQTNKKSLRLYYLRSF